MSINEIPIERFICNFINEVPLPPPGKAEVQYGIGDKIISFTRPPLNKPILDVDLPFRRVFECLNPSTILQLFTCLLLEQKILMHSHRLSLLVDVAELLQAFMYPMSWGHVYVPVLPRGLFDVIKAPMPFLLGTNSAWMDQQFHEDVLNQVDDVVILNIDTSNIIVPEWLKLPSLPSRERKKLDKQLQDIAQPVHAARGQGDDDMWRAITWEHYDSAFQFAARPCDVASGDVLHEDNLLVLRDHFFRFFVSLLRSYEKHIKRPDGKTGVGAMPATKNMTKTTANKNARQPWFDKVSFLKEQSRYDRPFVSKFLDTQACTNFINECMHEPSYDVVFFNEKIVEKKNRSRWVISRKPATPFLKNKEFAVSKTVVCAAPDGSGLEVLRRGEDEEEEDEGSEGEEEGEKGEEESSGCTTPRSARRSHRRHEGRKRRQKLRSQSFPALRPAFFIDPRPTPQLPDDGGDALSSLHARRTGRTNNLWLVETTDDGDALYLDFSATVHSTWFLAFTAMLDPSENAERHLATTPSASTPTGVSAPLLTTTMATTMTTTMATPSASGGGSSASGSKRRLSHTKESTSSALMLDDSLYNDVLSSGDLSPAESPRTTKRRTSRRFSRSFDGGNEFDFLTDGTMEIVPLNGLRAREELEGGIREEESDDASDVTAEIKEGVVTTEDEDVVLSLRTEEESTGGESKERKRSSSSPAAATPTLVFSPPTPHVFSSSHVSHIASSSSISSPATTGRRTRADSSMASTRKVERERKSTQLLLLSRAFEVLDRMKAREVDRDDFVYRALIDTACRVGSTVHAMSVLKEMRNDRLRPSALFFSCLLSAFAMDGTLQSGYGAGEQLPMGELTAWMNETADGGGATSVDSRNEAQRKSRRGGHEKRLSTATQVAAAMSATPKESGGSSGENGDSTGGATTKTSSSSSSSSSAINPGHSPMKQLTRGESFSMENFAKISGGGGDQSPEKTAVEKEGVEEESSSSSASSIFHKNGNLSRHGYSLLQSLFPSLHIETDMETCPKCHVSLNRTQILDGFSDDSNNYTTQCHKCQHWFVAYFSVLCNSHDWVGTQGPKSPLYFPALSPWVLKKEMLTMLVQSRTGGSGGGGGGDGGGSSGKQHQRVGAQHLRHESSTIFWNLVLYFEMFGLPCEFLMDQEEIDEVVLKQQAEESKESESSFLGVVPELPPRPKNHGV